MLCPRCMGMRKIVEYDNLRRVFYSHICEHCNGTGELEQTNEEWFCGLSTEEKAEFLSNSGMFESCNEAMFWLKEKHDDN